MTQDSLPRRMDDARGVCPTCTGNGQVCVPYATPTCCGNFYDNGECRGHCSVEEWRYDEWAMCEDCCGTGQVKP